MGVSAIEAELLSALQASIRHDLFVPAVITDMDGSSHRLSHIAIDSVTVGSSQSFRGLTNFFLQVTVPQPTLRLSK
jgi:hypothetical protein